MSLDLQEQPLNNAEAALTKLWLLAEQLSEAEPAAPGWAPSCWTANPAEPQTLGSWLHSHRARLHSLRQRLAALIGHRREAELAASDLPGLAELVHSVQAAEGTVRFWLAKGGDPSTQPLPLDPVVLQSLYDEDLALTPEQGQAMGMVRGTFLLLRATCRMFDQAGGRHQAHLSPWVQRLMLMQTMVLSRCWQSLSLGLRVLPLIHACCCKHRSVVVDGCSSIMDQRLTLPTCRPA